ncbi:MAG: hypothetical protein ACI84C_002341 [Flavobacteriales bacterium]|jgi:uncharacterized protein (DUF2147 family)
MKNLLLTFLFSLGATLIFAQSPIGKWKTIDDETGKVKSVIEIYEKDGKIFGKVERLFRDPSEDQDPKCDKCEDDRKDQRIIGMDLMRDMEKDGNEWDDGTICDPNNGTIYDCKFWLDEGDSDKLQVRGYVYFFFRTQTWLRVK